MAIADISIPPFFLAELAQRGTGPMGDTAEQAARGYAERIPLADALRVFSPEASVWGVALLLRIVHDTGNTTFWHTARTCIEHMRTVDAKDRAEAEADAKADDAALDDPFWKA